MVQVLTDVYLETGEDFKRLAGPVAGTGASETLYIVPASTKTKVRNIHIVNTTTGDLTFKMSIGVDGAGTRIFSDKKVPSTSVDGGVLDYNEPIPMDAAETLRWNAPTGLTVMVTGSERAV